MNKYLLLFAQIISFSAFAQISDSTRRQVEIAGAGYKLFDVLYTQYTLGVNFPAKKDNWYTNLAFTSTSADATKKGGYILTIYTFSIGKSYQWTKKHFFATLGLNTGPFYGVMANKPVIARHIGLGLVPKAEIGYNMKRTIISAGLYQSASVCYRAEFKYGVFQEQSKPTHYIRFIGAWSIYLKLTLK